MKRIFCWILAFAMLFALAACTSQQDNQDGKKKTKKEREDIITFCGLQVTPPDGYWLSNSINNYISLQNDEYEIHVRYCDPQSEEYGGLSAEALQHQCLDDLKSSPDADSYFHSLESGSRNGIYYVAITGTPKVGNMAYGFFASEGHSWIVSVLDRSGNVDAKELTREFLSWKCSTPKDGDPFLSAFALKIEDNSMLPTFGTGDRIQCEAVADPSALQEGDIIAYWTVIDGERVIKAHRITAIYNGGDYLVFETKGDDNPAPDPLNVHESEVIGKFIKVLDTSADDSEPSKSEPPEEDAPSSEQFVLEIQTDSMLPLLAPGVKILCEEVDDPATLQVGDIITYWIIIDGERLLNTHRIFAIYDGGGYLIFETKGDNRPDPDPLTVHESEIVGKFVKIWK